MNEILDAVLRLQRAFKMHDMDAPEVLILKTREAGLRLEHFLASKNVVDMPQERAKPVEHPDGSVYMEMEIAGMKVRYPANRVAISHAHYEWK